MRTHFKLLDSAPPTKSLLLLYTKILKKKLRVPFAHIHICILLLYLKYNKIICLQTFRYAWTNVFFFIAYCSLLLI